MQRKRIVLHIGAHKTGTTSVQHYFTEHRHQLEAAGILYPRSGRHHHAQHRLAFALRGKRLPGSQQAPELAVEAKELRDELGSSSCPTVLISSEELFSLPLERMEPLRELLADYEVEVLAVLRRPDELFASVYNQKVKEPRNKFMQRHPAFIRDPAKLSPDLDFKRVLESWSKAFGADAMRVRCIEQYPNAVVLVSEVIGYEPGMAALNLPRKNVSATVRAAEVIRLGKAAHLSEAQLRALRGCVDKVFGAAGPGESLLAPGERLQILRNLDAMTDSVFHRFLGKENLYSSRRFQEGDFPVRTTLQNEDLIKLIAELIPTPEE